MNKRKNSTQMERPVPAFAGKVISKHPVATPHRAPDNTHPISKNYGFDENSARKKEATRLNGSFGSMRLGTVNFFNEDSGYGFIRDIMTKESFFVYRSCLKESVIAKDRVSFEIEKTPGGSIAANVRKLIPPLKK
jgi:cold shock CspA family protein